MPLIPLSLTRKHLVKIERSGNKITLSKANKKHGAWQESIEFPDTALIVRIPEKGAYQYFLHNEQLYRLYQHPISSFNKQLNKPIDSKQIGEERTAAEEAQEKKGTP